MKNKNRDFYNLSYFLLYILSTNLFAQPHISNIDPVIQKGHFAEVTALLHDKDNDVLISSGFDNAIVLWDIKTGREINTLRGSISAIKNIALDNNNKLLAGSSDGQDISVWNYDTGEKISAFFDHVGYINALDFSPNGKYLASAGDDAIYVYELDTGSIHRSFYLDAQGFDIWFATFKDEIIQDIEFSMPFKDAKFINDNTLIAVSGDFLVKLDIKNNTLETLGQHHNAEKVLISDKQTISISPDSIHFWDEQHSINNTLIEFDQFEFGLVQKGKKLIGEFSDAELEIPPAPLRLTIIQIALTSIEALQDFLPSYRSKLDSLNQISQTQINSINLQSKYNFIDDVSISNDKLYISAQTEERLDILEVNLISNKKATVIKQKKTDSRFQFHPIEFINGNTIAYTKNNSIQTFDTRIKSDILEYKGYVEPKLTTSISPNGRYIIAGNGFNPKYEIWDLSKAVRLVTHPVTSYLEKNDFKPSVLDFQLTPSFIFSHDSKKFAAKFGNSIRILNILNGTEYAILHHDDIGYPVSFVDNNKKLITKSDSTIHIWNVESEKLIQSYTGHAFNFQKKTLAQHDHETNTTTIVNTELNEIIISFKSLGLGTFSPEGGKYVDMVQFLGGKIYQIWDIDKKTPTQPFKASDLNYSRTLHTFSPDGSILVTGGYAPVRLWDTSNGKLIKELKHAATVSDLQFTHDGKKLLSSGWDGSIKLWDINTFQQDYMLVSIGANDYSIVSGDNYYKSSKDAHKGIHFRDKDLNIYPFENFDLLYNRPDIILNRIGTADESLISAYNSAYKKRLQKLDFDETKLSNRSNLPSIEIVNIDSLAQITQSSKIRLKIRAEDTLYKLDRINIWVNDVPLNGVLGYPLHEKSISTISELFTIPLSQGKNKIQAAVLNEAGFESNKETIYVTYTPKNPNKPNLYIIGIGASKYLDTNKNLKNVDNDIFDLVELYKSREGDMFNKVIVKTLINEDVLKENLPHIKQLLKKSHIDDLVLILYSGHGNFDRNEDYYLYTYDTNHKNLAQRGIAYNELEKLLDNIPSRKKLLIVNACKSGEYDNDKMTFEMMNALFSDLRRGSGSMIISSSTADQDSFTGSTKYGNNSALGFTLISILNNSSSMTVNELNKRLNDEVSHITHGKQQPTMRRANLENDFTIW